MEERRSKEREMVYERGWRGVGEEDDRRREGGMNNMKRCDHYRSKAMDSVDCIVYKGLRGEERRGEGSAVQCCTV